MNVAEARKKAANAAEDIAAAGHVSALLQKIKATAEEGLYALSVDREDISWGAIIRIEALGYKVNAKAFHGRQYLIISWEVPATPSATDGPQVGEPTSSDAKTPAVLAKTLDRSHLAKLHDSALFLGEPACSSFRDLIASHLAVLDQLDLHKKYVIRRTTLAPATWADGVPRKSEPSEIYYDWWVGGVCFANLLTPQCTRLTFEQARSLAGYMNRYKGPGQQTFDVCLAEPIEFALDGTITGGAS